jgi:hypothetical protein
MSFVDSNPGFYVFKALQGHINKLKFDRIRFYPQLSAEKVS